MKLISEFILLFSYTVRYCSGVKPTFDIPSINYFLTKM